MLRGSLLNVITPATTHDLTTLEIVKDELNVTDASSDTRFARWISATSDYIEKFCNRVFATEQVSELWRASDRGAVYGTYMRDHLSDQPDALSLRRFPIVEITSITENTGGDPLTTDDYEMEVATGLLWKMVDGYRSHWWGPSVTVTYTGGYDLPDHPPPALEQACLMLIKIRNDGINRDRLQRAQVIPGVLEEQWWNPATPGQPGMPPEVEEILTPFRYFNPP